jgi:hypothetical protein
MDDPQSTVRAEHGNTAHEWWRHGSGAGHAGMHSGLDIGAGYHNLHWDTTNPSTGRGGFDLSHPLTQRGQVCSYGAGPLVDHARNIGWGPFSGDPLSSTRNQPSPFHEIELATSYPEVQQRMTGFPEVASHLTSAAGEVEALRERSRELASASAPESGTDPRAPGDRAAPVRRAGRRRGLLRRGGPLEPPDRPDRGGPAGLPPRPRAHERPAAWAAGRGRVIQPGRTSGVPS